MSNDKIACVWAIVPVKNLDEAKSRLSPLLTRDQRRAFALAMLEDVLSTLGKVKNLSRILVVSRDPAVIAAAAQHGAEAASEPKNSGQNGAAGFAASLACRNGAKTILVIPGDIPLLDSGEVATLLGQHGMSPAVTIVPDRHGLGTNALVCSPPDVLPFQFGERSLAGHVKAAEERGLGPSILHFPSMALDIDTPEDISELKHRPKDAGAIRYLRGIV